MSKLLKSGAFVEDAYAPVADDAALPDGAVLVSLARFQKDREALLAQYLHRGTPIARSVRVAIATLLATLILYKLESIPALPLGGGIPQFDSASEAVAKEESTQVPDGKVLRQVRKGYKFRNRLLRPAGVIVAKKLAA